MKHQPFVYFLSKSLGVAAGVHYAAAGPELMHTNDVVAAAAAEVDSFCGRAQARSVQLSFQRNRNMVYGWPLMHHPTWRNKVS